MAEITKRVIRPGLGPLSMGVFPRNPYILPRNPAPRSGLMLIKDSIVVQSADRLGSYPDEYLIVRESGEETTLPVAWFGDNGLKAGDVITMYFISKLSSRENCIGVDLNGKRQFRLILEFPQHATGLGHIAFEGRGPRGA